MENYKRHLTLSLPEEVKKILEERARKQYLKLGPYCKQLLVERALKDE